MPSSVQSFAGSIQLQDNQSITIGNNILYSTGTNFVINAGLQTTNLFSDIGSIDYPFRSIYVSTGSILIGPTASIEINNNGLISSTDGFAAPYFQVGATNPGQGILLYQQQNKLFFQNELGASGPVSVFNVASNSINNVSFTGGNIGIGISNPAYQLDVNGTGHFVNLIVDNITGALSGLPTIQGPVGSTGPTGPTNNNFSLANFDAFQRLRVSSPFTLFDSSMIYKDNGKFDKLYTGANSTGTYNVNQSSFLMTVGTGTNSQVLRQSYRVFPYQPGKSLEVLCSFVMAPSKPNLIQRVGYFNSQNGVFVELDGSTLSFVIRSFTSGLVVENRITQSNWNYDSLQGTGPSGLTLDITKAQILILDFEWLGVGTVRAGFVINGQIYYAQLFQHANLITSTYMTTACLPVSYQILNNGITTSGSTLKQICSTVLSEGGYQASSPFFTKGTDLSLLSIAQTPIITPVVSIRIKSGRPYAIVIPAELNLILTTTDTIQYFLILNGVLNTSSFVSYGTNSNVETDQTAVTVTGGSILQQGFVISSTQSKTSISLDSPESFNFQLGTYINGTSDVITLACSSISGTASVLGLLGWYELN